MLCRYGVLALGLVALAVGGVLLAQPSPSAFGWTAYAPLTNTTFVPSLLPLSHYLGDGAIVIGLALTAGWIGFRLGRRGRA